MDRRPIGNSELKVHPVAMGCWPIAGMTSAFVNDIDSLATLQAALDSGIDFLDTAYGYGENGESEILIGKVLQGRTDHPVVASKAGMAWHQGQRVFDASPQTIFSQCDASLRRLQRDHIDLYYLHAPDDRHELEQIAETFLSLRDQGKIRAVGVSNLTVSQLDAFQSVCPIDAVQDYFNMLQQDDRADVIGWCQQHQASFVAYWPLMKGLLAGRLKRNHRFADTDSRPKYDIYRGEQWQRNQDFVDQLKRISADVGITVVQLVIAWTIQVDGIHSVLCGAKRPYQILESSSAGQIRLEPATCDRIRHAIEQRLLLTA